MAKAVENNQKGELSALQIDDTTDMICSGQGKFKFYNRNFQKPVHKMYDYTSDLKLKLGSKVYHIHRELLSSSSPYFAAMLSVNMQEKEQSLIELHEMSEVGFDHLIEYFYHGHITIDELTIGDVLEAARFYQVEWLVNVCTIYMVQYMSFCDYESALKLADIFHLGDISSAALDFVGRQFATLIDRGEAKDLCFEVLISLLQSDKHISVPESTLFSFLHEHWHHDEDKYQKLLSNLRLCLLEERDLEIIRGDDIYSEQVDIALAYVSNPCSINLKNNELKTLGRGAKPTLVVFSTISDITEMHCKQLELQTVFVFTLDTSQLNSYLGQAESCKVDNFIILVGGYDHNYVSSDQTLIFDTNDFSFIPVSVMKQKRVKFGLCSVETEDRILLFSVGGICHSLLDINSDQENILSSVEMFNPILNSWIYLPSLPKAIFDLGAAFIPNSDDCNMGLLYICGGASNDMDDPLPLFDMWRLCIPNLSQAVDRCEGEIPNTEWEKCPPMQNSRQNHAMLTWNGKIYVFGGVTVADSRMTPCLGNEMFDPNTGSWTDLPPTPVEYGRISNKWSLVNNSLVYLCSSLGLDDEEDEDVSGNESSEKVLRVFDLHRAVWVPELEEKLGESYCSHIAYLKIALHE